jgi:sec-independent protein translocase protein TatA
MEEHMPSLGAPELIIILVVVIIIFGVGRLPEVGGALGKGIKEFRRSAKTEDETEATTTSASTAGAEVPPPQPVTKSGERNT